MKNTINAIIITAGIAASATAVADDFNTVLKSNSDAAVNYSIYTYASANKSVVNEQALELGVLSARARKKGNSFANESVTIDEAAKTL